MTTDTENQPALPKPSNLALRIARELGETNYIPIGQIKRIVTQCGSEQALAWLDATHAVEANGGWMLPDGTRRRTPGGVYFYLVRHAITPEQYAAIFGLKRRLPKDAIQHTPGTPGTAPAQRTAPAPVPFVWEDRGQLVKEATAGKATTVKITIIGKPGKVVERPGFVLVLLKRSGPLPPLPKGVPVPAPVPDTDYILYIGSKQWAKVKDAIKQPEDVLIVEGVPLLDPKFSAITVYATNVTTKMLQQAVRTAKQG